jgi:DNA-binding NarL/FixJ family response regulator
VLIVDDQPLIRSALRALLDGSPDIAVIGDASNGAEALRAVAASEPDVVLMDIRMPTMDGIAATDAIRRDHPDTEVVILTTFDEDGYALDAVRAGAAGFLLKDGDADDLMRGIRLAASGESLVAPATLRRLMARVAQAPRSDPDVLNRLQRLSPRETEVLVCAARGLNNTEIANELVISEATAKTHLGSILAKLEVRDRVQAVVLAYRGGLA